MRGYLEPPDKRLIVSDGHQNGVLVVGQRRDERGEQVQFQLKLKRVLSVRQVGVVGAVLPLGLHGPDQVPRLGPRPRLPAAPQQDRHGPQDGAEDLRSRQQAGTGTQN